MKRHQLAVGAAAAVALATSLAGCGSSGTAASGESKTITIGTIGAFSGPDASTGDANLGVMAYFKNLDSQGGIDGYTVNVVQGDDQYNAALSPGIARKLVPQVQMFCGNNGTDQNLAAQSILAQAKIPNVAPATGSVALANPVTDTQYLVVPDYGRLTAGLLDYAVNNLHKSRIAVIYTDDASGTPVFQGAQAEAAKLGVPIVASATYSATATSMDTQVQKVKAANPDFVIGEGVTNGAALMVNAAQSIGLKTTWGNLFFGATPQYADLTKSATDGSAYFAGFVDAPSAAKGVAAMKVVHSIYPNVDPTDTHAMQGWTLADSCAALIKKTLADGLEPTAANFIKEANQFTLDDDYVHGLKWSSASHSGVTQYQIVEQKGNDFVPISDFAESPAIN